VAAKQQPIPPVPTSAIIPPVAPPTGAPDEPKPKKRKRAASKNATKEPETPHSEPAAAERSEASATAWSSAAAAATSAPVPAAVSEPAPAAWYDGNRFECKKCEYATSSFEELGGHLAGLHQAGLEDGEGGAAYTKSAMMYQCHVCMGEIYHEKSAISYHLHTAHGLDLDTYGRSYVIKQEKEAAAATTATTASSPLEQPAAAVQQPISAAVVAPHSNHYSSPYLGLYNMYDPRAHHHQSPHHGLVPDPGVFQNGFVSPAALPRDHYERPLMGAAEQLERARHFDRTFHIQNSHHFRSAIRFFFLLIPVLTQIFFLI
jgi:hypothetical protein